MPTNGHEEEALCWTKELLCGLSRTGTTTIRARLQMHESRSTTEAVWRVDHLYGTPSSESLSLSSRGWSSSGSFRRAWGAQLSQVRRNSERVLVLAHCWWTFEEMQGLRPPFMQASSGEALLGGCLHRIMNPTHSSYDRRQDHFLSLVTASGTGEDSQQANGDGEAFGRH